jgi:PAS domain S-box-containing protein
MLSGHGDEQVVADAFRAGASDYLSKAGLTEDSLATAIRHAISAHESARVHRAAEDALRASEERYHGLFDRNLGGMFRLAADGRVLDCNPASARILGYGSVEEVRAHNSIEFFADPADAPRLIERIRQERFLGDAVGSDPSVAARLTRIKEAVARIRNVVGRLTQITRLEVDTALQDPAERLRLPDQRD